MKVYIERENKTVESTAKTGTLLLKELGINPAEILLIRGDDVILPEETLTDSDDIKILSVVSGG